MRIRTNQLGFSAVELVIVVVIVTVVGFIGYAVYNRQHNTTTASTSNSTPNKTSDVATAPKVTNTSDLDKASATLDQTDPGGSNNADTSQLDTQLANF